MLGAAEIVLLAVLTWGLTVYCIRDASRRRASPGTTTWIVILSIGLLVWPVAWLAVPAYLVDRRRGRVAV